MDHWFICLIILNTIIFQSSANNNSDIKIEDYENKNDGSGNSYFRYTLSDGSTREESVRIVNKDTENEYPVIEGKYSYYVKDEQEHKEKGVKYTVNYVADINGFRSQTGEKDEADIDGFRSPTGEKDEDEDEYSDDDDFYAGTLLITTLQGGGIG